MNLEIAIIWNSPVKGNIARDKVENNSVPTKITLISTLQKNLVVNKQPKKY